MSSRSAPNPGASVMCSRIVLLHLRGFFQRKTFRINYLTFYRFVFSCLHFIQLTKATAVGLTALLKAIFHGVQKHDCARCLFVY